MCVLLKICKKCLRLWLIIYGLDARRWFSMLSKLQVWQNPFWPSLSSLSFDPLEFSDCLAVTATKFKQFFFGILSALTRPKSAVKKSLFPWSPAEVFRRAMLNTICESLKTILNIVHSVIEHTCGAQTQCALFIERWRHCASVWIKTSALPAS